jgi:DNA-binding protein H-NS
MLQETDKETAIERIKRLRAEADKLLKDAKSEALTRAQEAVAELNSLGFRYALSDGISSRGKAKRPRSSLPPKFRHPTDHTLTWAGKGKMPLWMQELIDAGSATGKDAFLNPERTS